MASKYKSRGNIYEEKVGNRVSYKVVYKGKTKRFKDKTEAKKYLLDQMISDDETSENSEVNFTYHEMAKKMLNFLKKERKFSTYMTKKDIIEKNILPHFVDKPIEEISKIELMNFRDWLLETDYSTVTKNSILIVFKQVFSYADTNYDLLNRYYRKVKSFSKTEADKLREEEASENVWEPEDFEKFIGFVKRLYYQTFFTLSITAWTRLGETTALTWSDYDGQQIHVHRNIIKVRKNVNPHCFQNVSVKTKKGNRWIILPESTCRLLDDLKAEQMKRPGFKEDWYIFNRWDGSKYLDGYVPMARTNIYRVFDIAKEKSQVRDIRIHDLRHSGATHAIVSGEDIKAVSERLGHEDIETTLRVYHHAINKTKAKLMKNTGDFARICQKD